MAFQALEVAIQLAAALQPIVKLIAKHDAELADQLSRARSSNVLNLSEGAERVGKDQVRFFRTALGSVTEARDCVRLAVAYGIVGEADLVAVAPLLDRSRAIDWRLVHRR